MPEEDGSLRVAPVARGDGGSPAVEDDAPRAAPATESVTQMKGMTPKPGSLVSLEAMDEAVVRAVAGRLG